MGTHRFRLSDMIPNSWVHKLKEMARTRSQNINNPRKKKPPPTSSKSSSSTATSIPPPNSKTEQPHPLYHKRKSYYFTRELTPSSPQTPNPRFPQTNFPESPRKSPKQTKRRSTTTKRTNRVVTSTVSASCSCRATVDSSSDFQSLVPEFGYDHDHDHGMVSSPFSCYCRVQNEIVINMNEEKPLTSKFDGFDTFLEIELPPIVTKKPNAMKGTNQQEKQRSPGVRLRTNSPIIACRKIQGYGRKNVSSSYRSRKGLSESFAVVKSSADPQRDFKESMVEMILENNLRASKDLEDLLACYLQLNSDEYHELIVEAFKQIWFDIAGVTVK